MIAEVPAPGFTPTNGRQPRTGETLVIVQFRTGFIPNKRQPAHWWKDWTDTGSGADIVAVRRA